MKIKQRYLIGDTNPPDTDHWYYRLAEKEQLTDWAFFRQPGAYLLTPSGEYVPNPKGENIDNLSLGYKYYSDILTCGDPEHIKVHVLAEYGRVFSGRPVFADIYSDQYHRSVVPLQIHKGIPLRLGFDVGLNPACVVWQLTPTGGFNVLREYIGVGVGLKQFLMNTVEPAIFNEFQGLPIISHCDPWGGSQRSQNDETLPTDIFMECGLPTQLAPRNEFDINRDYVINCLVKTVGGKYSFQLDPSIMVCVKVLWEGINLTGCGPAMKSGIKTNLRKTSFPIYMMHFNTH